MFVENSQSSRIPMTMKYAHCPLKKRPVMVKEERPVTPPTTPPHPAHLSTVLNYGHQYETENEEPENLSTKPEDLSKTGNYPNKPSSPIAAIELKENSVWSRPRCESSAPNSTCLTRLEPRPFEVARPTAHYPYLAALYPPYPLEETYPVAPLYPRYSPASPSASCSPPPGPEDLRSPGSVSSDSGVSVTASRRPRYQCPDCAKSYSTYSGLSKHQQYHCAAAEGSLARKSFSCKYCAKVYTSLGALKMHIRTHTLPCKCNLCGKAFSRPWLLQGHIRTHTGEKPFSCQHCRRAFADRSNLRAHLQTHSDIKKYSCSGCGKTFSRMSLLSKHIEGGCASPAASPHYEFRADAAAAAAAPHHPLALSASVHAY